MSIKSWQKIRLGDIAENINVRENDAPTSDLSRFVGLEHLDSGEVDTTRWGSTKDFKSGKRFQSGDVLLCRRRPYLRKCSAVDFEGVCSGDAYVIREKTDTPFSGLLKYMLNTERFWEYCIANSEGSLSPRVKWKHLEQYVFEVDIKKLRIIFPLLGKVTSIKSSYINISKDVNLLLKSFQNHLINQMLNSEIPSKIGTLDDLTMHISHGPFGSNLKSMHYADEGPRVIRLQNIGTRKFLGDDKAYISDEYYNSEIMKRYRLEANDIVFAGLGDDSNHIGRSFTVEHNILPAVQASDSICIRASEQINTQYLMTILNSNYVHKQIKRVSQGSTRLRINGKNLKKIKIPLPNKNTQSFYASTTLLLDSIIESATHQSSINEKLLQYLLATAVR